MPSIKATWFLGTLLMSCLVATATAVSVGANLSGVNDWTLSRPFVDLMRTARAFGSAQEPWDENPGPLGPNRWPLGDFGVIVVTAQAVGTLTGSYPFVVKGGGPNLQLGLVATSGQLSTPVYSAGTNMWTATMTLQSSATQVMFSVRNHNNSITAISIRRPGYADIQIFTDEFLAIVKPYSMLRFLEWAETNGNSIAEWSDRSTPQSAYSLHGAPWEWMVELANTVDADIWVNVPTLASEDYVLNLANLLKSSVERGRKIYVEYSNEVWNGDFAQYYWNRDLALDEVASGNSSLNYDGTTDPYTLAMRRVADRIKKISDLFTSVFGQNARNTRFRPVLASQMGNSWVLNKQVTYLEVVYGTPKKWIYAVAGAPYFNLGYARKWNNLTATQVLDLLEETAEGVPKNYSYTQQIGLAVYHKLKYLGYEGGPDTFGPGSIAAKETASLRPRIGTICRNYLLKWYSYGFSTFSWYIGDATSYNSEYGTWGVTNNITFLAATKYQALVNISNTPAPQLTAGILVPALIDARDFIGAPSDYKANNPKLCNFPPYAKYDYLLRLANAGNATFQLNQVVTPDAGFGCSVWVNSDFVANLTLPHQGSPADTAFTSSVSLQAGFAVVRLVFLPSPDFGNGWMGVSVGNVTVNGSAGDGYSAGENGNDESESASDDNGALGTTGDLVTSGGCSLSRLLYSAAAASISCLWRGWLAPIRTWLVLELLRW